jgi:hypothetical protein
MKQIDLVRFKASPNILGFGIILTEETRKYSVETKFFNVLINGAPRICVEHQLELISVCELELI